MSQWGWHPYVPVAKRRQNAQRLSRELGKAGKRLEPVTIEGRAIARTFWGQAWCENLESYGDYANRMPRGRTYVRNGSVIDLKIQSGAISALVSGSDIYTVKIELEALDRKTWKAICADCSGTIDSLLDLLAGKFEQGVMQRLTRREGGLFPKPREITMRCSCPDWATVCKHVAAVLYGVGARLDESPELLFVLRKVDHTEMLGEASRQALDRALGAGASQELEGEDLSALFGIDLDGASDGNEAALTDRSASSKPAPTAPRVAKAAKSRSPRATGKPKETSMRKSAKKKGAKNKAAGKKATGKKVAPKKVVETKIVEKKVAKKKAAKKLPSRSVKSARGGGVARESQAARKRPAKRSTSRRP